MIRCQTDRRQLAICCVGIALALALLPLPAQSDDDEAALRQMVASGRLAESPNSILLDYLLNEGREALPPELHQEAVDQMVEALRNQIGMAIPTNGSKP